VSKSERLAAAILADRDRPTSQHNIVPCLVCGYTFVYKGRRKELNGRFCSMRCQDWYDVGKAPITDQKVAYRSRFDKLMRMGPKGFYIDCAYCQKEFEGLGLRCCSPECERSYREREDNLAVMGEAGIEPIAKRQCEAPGCSATIPKWRNGRQVSKKTRFCSSKCQQRAKRAAA
jgi:hypothetical protein